MTQKLTNTEESCGGDFCVAVSLPNGISINSRNNSTRISHHEGKNKYTFIKATCRNKPYIVVTYIRNLDMLVF